MKKSTAKKKSKTNKTPTWNQIGQAVGKKLDKECENDKSKSWKLKRSMYKPACGGAGYGVGFIGALVYYISTATGFWVGVLGVLKALVWPAFLVYGVLKFIGM